MVSDHATWQQRFESFEAASLALQRRYRRLGRMTADRPYTTDKFLALNKALTARFVRELNRIATP